jgi:hypothetical protein
VHYMHRIGVYLQICSKGMLQGAPLNIIPHAAVGSLECDEQAADAALPLDAGDYVAIAVSHRQQALCVCK